MPVGNEVRQRLGDLYRDNGLVFTSRVDTLINPTNLRKRSFEPLVKRAKVPPVRFHDLRHTCATLLFGRGVHPKYVQELLGHSNIAITLDTYSHVIPGGGTDCEDNGGCVDPTEVEVRHQLQFFFLYLFFPARAVLARSGGGGAV